MLYAVQFLLFLLLLYVFRNAFYKSKYKWPPGPIQLPFIGSIVSVLWADFHNPSQAFMELSKKYGPIFSIKVGPAKMVVLNGHKFISSVEFSDKLLSHVDTEDIWVLEKTAQLPLGIAFSLPEFWSKTRPMVQKTLHDFGFHSNYKTEVIILEEIVEFCDALKRRMTNGQLCLTIETQFTEIFYNIVWTLMTGEKCTSDDALFRKNIIKSVMEYVKSSTFGGGLGIVFPKLIKMFPNLCGYNRHKQRCEQWRQLLRDATAHHRTNRNYDAEPDNFLDAFLSKIDATEPHENPLDTIYTEENLVAVMQDLIVGGVDTEANFMNFFVRYLLQNPQTQDELFAEVDQVLGKRPVNVDDIPKLIQTQAAVYEVLRLSTTVPITPRKLLSDWEVNGFLIPKGTFIAVNLIGINRDESVWKDAEKFNPNRFLSPENKIINSEKIFTFGFGKRRCIGESLVKTNLMLLIATLVQQFSFQVDPAFGVPSDKVVVTLSAEPAPYNVVIKSRQQ